MLLVSLSDIYYEVGGFKHLKLFNIYQLIYEFIGHLSYSVQENYFDKFKISITFFITTKKSLDRRLF